MPLDVISSVVYCIAALIDIRTHPDLMIIGAIMKIMGMSLILWAMKTNAFLAITVCI